MFIGRYQLGEQVPLACWARMEAFAPNLPSGAPVARVYSPAFALVKQVKLPICDRHGVTAFFQGLLKLDASFGLGQHHVHVAYTVGGVAAAKLLTFEVLAGGHPDGCVIGLHAFKVAPATWAIAQLDGGRIIRRRNPKVIA